MRPTFPLAVISLVVFSASTFALDGHGASFFSPSPAFSFVSMTATVTISGRVKTPEGRPIKTASIVLRDADSNQVVCSTFSSAFGFYRLEQIETGRSYVLSVSHKRYLFAFPAQLMEISEDRIGVDFTGEVGDEN